MSMTFMGDGQRRHRERRNQNDHGRNACKLLLQAHAIALSQVPSAAKQIVDPGGCPIRQFRGMPQSARA
jgi:hypothetical protein